MISGAQMQEKSLAASMLRKLETASVFAALLLALVLEAGCVYWLRAGGIGVLAHARPSANMVAVWADPTLPQCWLAGALLVLVYRALAMAMSCGQGKLVARKSHREAFFRLWRWTMAVSAVQIGALYLDHVAMGVR